MVRHRIVLLFLAGLTAGYSWAQRGRTLPRYSFGVQVDVGHSFPDLPDDQDAWKATFYPAGGMALSLTTRLGERWSIDLGLGMGAYALSNKGNFDNYVLDMASPLAMAGVCYNTRPGRYREAFLRTLGGSQLGYSGRTVDRSTNYMVVIDGGGPLIGFLRQEVGIRKHARRRMHGSSHSTAFELGTFFRYNLRALGSVQFIEPGSVVRTEPNGNVIGMYFRYLIPLGDAGVKRRSKPATTPTRFRDTRDL